MIVALPVYNRKETNISYVLVSSEAAPLGQVGPEEVPGSQRGPIGRRNLKRGYSSGFPLQIRI